MQSDTSSPTPSYPLADLCVLADLPPRTIRYYVQMGLVDRPQGETRAARYGAKSLMHLSTLTPEGNFSSENAAALLQNDRAQSALLAEI